MNFIFKSVNMKLSGEEAEKLINKSELCRSFGLNINTFNSLQSRNGWNIEQTLAYMLAEGE